MIVRWLAPALGVCGVLLASCTGDSAPESQNGVVSVPFLPKKKPNVLFILSDDQRADAFECMGRFKGRVASRGVTFSHYAVSTSLCCPARSSILTGKYAHNHGVVGNGGDVDDGDLYLVGEEGAHVFEEQGNEDLVFAKWFEDAGYTTGFFGKYLNGYEELTDADADGDGQRDNVIPPHWDEWHAFQVAQFFNFELLERGRRFAETTRVCYLSEGLVGTEDTASECAEDADVTIPAGFGRDRQNYSTDVLAALAEQFIVESAAADAPFFLYFAPNAPHRPFYSPARYQPDPDELAFTPEALARLEGCPSWEWKDRPASYFEADVSDKPEWVQAQVGQLDEETVTSDRKMQLASVLATEDAIDRLIDALERAGIADDTIIVYSSDNGRSWGEHWWHSKNCAYDECSRVPLVILDPRHPAGGITHDGLAQNIDLAPTFADLTGVPLPDGAELDGMSLAPIATGATTAWPRDRSLTECWGTGGESPDTHAAVRTSRWKYIEHYADPERQVVKVRRDGALELELYDLEQDPSEADNLLLLPPERVAELGYARADIDAIVADLAPKLHELETQ